MQICDLLLNLRLHLFRCAQIPEAAERIHIKWKIVELILVNSYRRIYIIIKILKIFIETNRYIGVCGTVVKI